MICAKCKYFEYIQDDFGRCRRMPPTTIVVGDQVISLWSEVKDKEWCGEYDKDTGSKRAKKLLLDGGYLQPSKLGMAVDADNNPVAAEHPMAKKFTLLGAVRRAIFDLCEEDFRSRERLYTEVQAAITRNFAGTSAEYQFLCKATTGSVVELIDTTLNHWEQ